MLAGRCSRQIVIDGEKLCRRRGFGYQVSSEAGSPRFNAEFSLRGLWQNVVRVTRIDFRWSQLEQTAIKLKKYKAQDP